jgi:hypothetical protein
MGIFELKVKIIFFKKPNNFSIININWHDDSLKGSILLIVSRDTLEMIKRVLINKIRS